MKNIETGSGKGRPAKKVKKKPVGPVAPKPQGVFAEPVGRQGVDKPRPVKKPAVRKPAPKAALDVLPTGKGAKPKPYRPPVATKVVRKAAEQHQQHQHEAKDTKGNSDRLPEKERQKVVNEALVHLAEHVTSHPKDYKDKPVTKNLAKLGLVDDYQGYPARSQALRAATTGAPVLKVLDQTTRPLHAIAGATDAAVTGKSPSKIHHAFTRGIENKDKTTFSTVLKHAGAPKIVQKIGGGALDLAADPTTYVGFGTASVAKKAALSAGEKAALQATKAGMSEAGAKTAATAAAKKAEAAAPAGKGVTVSFGGKSVPGVTRATAASARVAKKVAAKAPTPARKAAAGGKDIAREFRPMMAPGGADQAEHVAARQAARKARTTINHGAQKAEAQARALRDKIGEKNYAAVIDAVERDDFSKLSPELAKAAHFLRSQLKGAKRIRRRAGLSEGTVGAKVKQTSGDRERVLVTAGGAPDTHQLGQDAPKASPVKGYFPHAQDEPLRQGLGLVEGTPGPKNVKGGGTTVPAPGSARSRDIKLPISEANAKLAAEGKGEFSSNIPLVKVNYDTGTAKVQARSQLFKDLAANGRPIKIKVATDTNGKVVRDIPDVHLRDGDQIYHLGSKSGTFGLHEVDPKEWAKGTVAKNGQFVVLNKKVVDAALESAKSAASSHVTGRAFDKVTRGFKSVATATPGFHVRNAIGDTTMAYYVQPGHRLPVNLAQAAKAVKGMRNQQKAVENLAASVDDHGTIKVAGKRMPRQKFLKLAEDNGVTQSGKIGRELRDLEGATGKAGVKKVKRRLTNNKVIQTLTTDRENVVRLSTFKHGLDQGLSPAEAADLSLNTHIDYGDLADLERRYARRLMPFYTFSARALPTHFKTLVQRPGKFATFQKLREETGSTALDSSLPEYQQRQAPLNIAGKSVSAGLPLSLLNEIPTSANPAKFGAEAGNYLLGMLSPVIKDPLEYGVNKSFFFRSDIQNSDAPLVAAPSWVKYIPEDQRKKLGIVPDFIDKRSGKKVWGWPGKVDYLAKAVPGLPNIAQQLTTSGANRRGQGTAEKAASALSGVKVQPYDANSTRVQNTAKALAAVNEKIHALSQRGIGAQHPTHEYTTLRNEQKRLEQQLYQGKKARGDKVLPKAGAPVKVKDPFADKLDHAINSSSEDFSKKLDAAMNKLGS